MAVLNTLLRQLVDLALLPFRGFHPLVGLTVISLVAAVVMLLVFKKTSNQTKLDEVKRRIHACLFEIRLYNDNLRAIFRAQLEILRHNLSYMRLTVVPMLWVIVPLVFILAQLEYHYAYQGLKVGQDTIVTAVFAEEQAEAPELELAVPTGLRLETPGLWAPSIREMAWRVAAVSEGDHTLQLSLNGQAWEKSVRVTDRVVRLSPLRPDPSLELQFIYPAEPPLPEDSPLEAITVGYPPSDLILPWWLVFLILSLVFALLIRKRLGVTI